MRPRVLTILAMLCMLLTAAVCFAWIQSYWHYRHAHTVSNGVRWAVYLVNGECLLEFAHDYPRSMNMHVYYALPVPDPANPSIAPDFRFSKQSRWHALGFGFDIERRQLATGEKPVNYYFTLPCWMPTFVLGICAACLLRQRQIALRRANEQLCATCGYDLRATPDRCHECGTPRSDDRGVRRSQ